MSWPSGNILQAAKTQALSSLGVGSKASLYGWVPLTEWRKFSAVSVVASSATQIDLHCNTSELRGSLVGEVEAWADREAEMRSHVLRSSDASVGAQDSWFLVTGYYWAAFSSCLLMRLLGSPVFRMSAADLSVLKVLAGAGATIPTEGSFRLTQVAAVSATQTHVRLKRLKSNYHQALWTGLVASINELVNAAGVGNANPVETKLLKALLDPLTGNNAKLSELRNAVNYRSGTGFPASKNGVGFTAIADARGLGGLDGLKLLVNMSSASSGTKALSSDVFCAESARYLFWSAVTLSAFSSSLYAEVSDVLKFDHVWSRRRRTFLNSLEVGVPPALRAWAPFL